MLYFWRLEKVPQGPALSDSIMVVRQILALKVRVRALVGQQHIKPKRPFLE
jgi:pyruvate kinase